MSCSICCAIILTSITYSCTVCGPSDRLCPRCEAAHDENHPIMVVYSAYPPRYFLKFLESMNMADRSVLPPGTHHVKRFKLQNVGKLTIPANTIRCVSIGSIGSSRCELPQVIDRELAAGEIFYNEIPFITATEPGRYVEYVRFQNTITMQKLGPRMWIDYVIEEN